MELIKAVFENAWALLNVPFALGQYTLTGVNILAFSIIGGGVASAIGYFIHRE